MLRGLRHPFAIVVLVVALMSGILSLVREYLLFQFPTRFQEKPLFWACLRVACVISFAFLWYEERRKRILLEESPTPVGSLQDQLIQLSTSILEFIYERIAGAPKITPSPRFIGFDGGPEWLQSVNTYGHEQKALSDYNQATFGMYKFRYERLVLAALPSLKSKGVDTSQLEQYIKDLSNHDNPDYEGISIVPDLWIKSLGKELGTMADLIKEA